MTDTCIDCGLTPTLPNELNQYEDADGDPYAQCDRCIDFEADWYDARHEPAFRSWLSGAGYGIWQQAWEDTETPEQRRSVTGAAYVAWEQEQKEETKTA